MILAIIAGICALLFFANAVLRRWVVPTIGLILMLLSAIVLGVVYPAPSSTSASGRASRTRSGPTSSSNIAATRAAYGVDKVEITDYSAKTTATAGQLKADAEALPGIRLIDPTVVSPAYDQLQQVRGYYTFPNTLDVDRYTIDGKETDAVVAVREMDLNGVAGDELEQPADRLHPRLRAGRGVRQPPPVRRRARVDRQGHPADRADRGARAADLLRRDGTAPASTRSSAPRPARAPIELDTPGGGEGGNPKTYTYSGKGGVPIGNMCQPAAVRGQVRRRQPAAVGPGEPGLQDHLRPDAAGAGAGGGAVAERRRGRLPGGGRGPDRVDRGRLHDLEHLPQQPTGRPQHGHLGLADHARATTWWRSPTRRHQLHAQLGQGGRRRVRRHGEAVRLGRRRPGAADLAQGVPRRGAAQGRDPRATCWTTCATRRTCSRCSGRSWPATT